MDYKKIIKSKKVRLAVLHFLSFIPDDLMVRIQYRIKTGRRLDLNSPKRYTEKLQWMKVFYRNEKMMQCADKYEVRRHVIDCGYGDILNEIYGVFDHPDEIDFDMLPKSFVLKDTLGSGGNSIILVYDKEKEDYSKLRNIMKGWINESYKAKNPGREWVYEGRRHRIIAEKILIMNNQEDLPDYKFFCFDGNVECLYMMRNYTQHHSDGELGFFSSEFKLIDAHRKDFAPMLTQPDKPKNYERMIEIAKALSKGFPHVRIDLYNLEGKIVFGEMTFFNASGYTLFEPDEFDFQMGEKFKLP